MKSPLRSKLVFAVKIAIVTAILGYLLYRNQEPLGDLWARDKDLKYLALSFFAMLTAVICSFVRWYLLVRALNFPFSLAEALRIGFVGYLFNFVGPSAVGGDLAKAVLLVRHQSDRRAEALATILLDRVLGLYSLMVVATVAILAVDATDVGQLRSFLEVVVWAVLAVTAVAIGLLLPSRYSERLTRPLTRLPWVGNLALRILVALDLYRQRRASLLVAFLLSASTHVGIALTVRFGDLAVHSVAPTFLEHLIISPLASVAAAAPLPGGMGTFELAMDYLYSRIPRELMESGQGFSVAVIYRLVTIAVAIIGVLYCFVVRSDLETDGSKTDAAM